MQGKCQLKPEDGTCAHAVGEALADQYPELKVKSLHLDKVKGLTRCGDGYPVRAKQLRDWALGKGTKVAQAGNQGNYLVYEENEKNGQGHVYAIVDGIKRGNNNFNWSKATKRIFIKLP